MKVKSEIRYKYKYQILNISNHRQYKISYYMKLTHKKTNNYMRKLDFQKYYNRKIMFEIHHLLL